MVLCRTDAVFPIAMRYPRNTSRGFRLRGFPSNTLGRGIALVNHCQDDTTFTFAKPSPIPKSGGTSKGNGKASLLRQDTLR